MMLERPQTGTFQELTIPHGVRLVGAAALVHELAIAAPVRRPSCVADQHVSGSRRRDGAWTVFDKRYWPGDDFADHLAFILKHEDADFLSLRRIFEATPQAEIEALVRDAPTALHVRRAWYLYETLTGRTLEVEDAPRAAAIDLLDPKAYFTGKPRLSAKSMRLAARATSWPPVRPTVSRASAARSSLSRSSRASVRLMIGLYRPVPRRLSRTR